MNKFARIIQNIWAEFSADCRDYAERDLKAEAEERQAQREVNAYNERALDEDGDNIHCEGKGWEIVNQEKEV